MPKFTVTRLTPEEAQAVWQAQSRLDPEFETVYLPMLNESNVGDALNIDMKAEGVEWMSSQQMRDIIYNLNEAAKRRTKTVTLTTDTLSDGDKVALALAQKERKPFVITTVDADDVSTTREYTFKAGKWSAIVPDPVVLRYKHESREVVGEVTDDQGKKKEVKARQYSRIGFRLLGLSSIVHRAKRTTKPADAPVVTPANGTATDQSPAPFEQQGAAA